MLIYDFKVKTIDDNEICLQKYKGKVLLIVNTASKCGFTPQYEELESLYKKIENEKFEILGFPCNQFANQEPGTNKDIKQFCKINYGVTFPVFAKINVNGCDEHPLYKYLKEKAPFKGFDESSSSGKLLSTFLNEKFPDMLIGNSIKWNFTKFLIDKNGNVVKRFESPVEPMQIENEILQLISK
ncbi:MULTISPECIES: glutathione peroxidase [Clostridium]|uniref:Glutathione peroxidase n=1 Tax=Clostridium ragsdalei P11 TaxID=1353534 RepID=A0A1A6AX61_9CLOT|nr:MULTISPECIES: glutathione peroxidase [Clostridium]OBR94676.1 hydroperoxy fatty acid reductase gpx1 [Clostridium ragsdalei P11]QXE20607.1 glutathione peroxidase [Clostridium sp. 001]